MRVPSLNAPSTSVLEVSEERQSKPKPADALQSALVQLQYSQMD
jgi:hypothetical protein